MDKSRGNNKNVDGNSKNEQLDQYRVENTGKRITTNEGLKVANNDATLKAGARGPVLMQDFHFFQKQMHFDTERIPERVVHARGFGVHGEFELYKSMKNYTKAGFLQEPGSTTPVFVRFSTVQGGKGSKDTARDIRGFAVKFYTAEGNYDLLGLQFPIFVLHDAFKFVDSQHALKPEPHNDMPTASAAHDNFWDFVANNQESAHFVMWAMSDRALPRSWRMMEGFPIHTFRFENEQGKATFVKFHWKPTLGVHSLLMEEAQIIGGVDPDYHRRDIREAIERGAYPVFELGVQLLDEKDTDIFDFDFLDPTKFWPEEIVPVEKIGKMTLNRNVDNFFAETEQVAFDVTNLVPGINFTDDPILQGRTFTYKITQQHRLGGSNYPEIPINQSLCPFHNNQRDGFKRHRIDVDQVNYFQNSIANNTPGPTPQEEGGFAHYPDKVEGFKVKEISESFNDFFSQARLFWNSMSPVEKQHIIEAFSFELAKVDRPAIRQQVVDMFVNVDKEMATIIADNVGANPPAGDHVPVTASSPAVSQAHTPHYAFSLRVGVLIGNGFKGEEVRKVIDTLQQNGVFVEVISEKLGTVTGADNSKIKVTKTFLSTHSVLFDSFYVVGGSSDNQWEFDRYITEFINDAYKHYKPMGIATTAATYIEPDNLEGIVFARNNATFNQDFVSAITKRRFWNRK
ncbi:catalase [Halalkalibacter akibai]|uniref:Catalase n=1 Tax=Halalkalibacter akibai (strain ATCC 43226 / DSM 21942 / CIP 109018 / JCM 9157 / 1139) TaxID=1236973 RepID=W4QXS2_HALA3|nr:catalase [Halalkalibacter akibai]GAE36129.1 catalase [Halalkalibacter akibai JCM 9157]